MTSVMISCGETSGDLYAGALTRQILSQDPQASVFGLGGDELRRAGAKLAGEYEAISVTGLTEVIKVLPHTLGMYRRLVALARERRPDVFVAIDYPDFNFRLAGAVRGLGVPVVYYVSPQLWAWRPGRLDAMRRFVDRMLVIFPFEERIYREAGIPVEFVGHPLVDLLPQVEPRDRFLASQGLRPVGRTIAILPGSRPNEVRRILPPLAAAAESIARDVEDAQFLLARAPRLDAALFEPFESACRKGLSGAIVESRTDQVLSASDVVLTASGTATIQTALHGKPMVIVYRLSPLTYRLGIRLVQVDTYGMVNLVAGRRVVPELIQDALRPEAVAHEALRFLTDSRYANETRLALAEVVGRLGGPGASQRAASAILRAASEPRARAAAG
jgi:lipid-A-disaccharide synthase